MVISLDQVRHLARLARLELNESEVERVSMELSSIVAHMDALRRAGMQGGAPRVDPEPNATLLRADQVQFDPLLAAPHQFAPAWEQQFFVVPRLAPQRVTDDDSEAQ